jgi:hypothetical protein
VFEDFLVRDVATFLALRAGYFHRNPLLAGIPPPGNQIILPLMILPKLPPLPTFRSSTIHQSRL